MSTVINSKEEPLPAPTVISMSIKDLDLKGISAEAAMLGIAKELTMESVDLVQIGNTVYIAHRGKTEKTKNTMVGRALNVDTAQNFVSNGFKYFSYLQEKGITKYITKYDGPIYDKAFEIWKRQADKDDAGTKIAVGRLADGNSQAYVSLSKTPLGEAT